MLAPETNVTMSCKDADETVDGVEDSMCHNVPGSYWYFLVLQCIHLCVVASIFIINLRSTGWGGGSK